MPDRLLLITPVYNEGRHMRWVAEAVAAQRRPPDLWIVADDGSTDDTLATLRALEREIDFLRVIEKPPDGGGVAPQDRLAVALEAQAFNRGLVAAGDLERFTHIGKLDGDVELPEEWFATLLERFAGEPCLGVAGGTLLEPEGARWRRIAIPDYHVHGAVKLYSRACLERIGGLQERLAWDTIDEVYARMHGYVTRSHRDLVARHLRPSASVGGRVRGRARHGECAWILHYSAPVVLARGVKLALERPRVLTGVAYVHGYLSAAARHVPRVPDQAFRRFTRRELRHRARRALLGLLRPGGHRT